MFRGLSSWFGLEQPAAGGRQSQGDGQPRGHSPPDQRSEAVAESAEGEPQLATNQELLHQAKGLGNYLFNFATAATKKITESVAETAQTIKKSVEEGKIDDIIDKDKRNFLRDPPAGVQFNFDFDQMYPVALVMLQEDELLSRMRFDLVPKLVKEDVFWRNYFYRVSLIKQSAQLTALAAQQQAAGKEEKNHGRQNELPLTEDSVDWEKELQQELQEYEVVAESEKRDENWDKEIEEMLKEEN
ncbi:SYAP1 [Cervus elaphus hippelaphus]|uniref:SYAP1 n=1 Tax=Cervus elaphus hippelaphus TaxID=46360 RepID=A0A212C1C4_CEREH|nr:SYAP1 [Cervus elaphus hippelaphus]